jgi:hypothetical protein
VRRSVLPAWACLVVWSAWLAALQGGLVSSRVFGAWVPDLGLVLLVGLAARIPRARARPLALAIAAVRVAFSTDPPLAILAGYLAAAEALVALRGIVEVDRLLPRALAAGLAALGLAAFWTLARGQELALRGLAAPGSPLGPGAWASAAATATAAALCLPHARRLPGLSPLWRGRGRPA